MSRDRRGPQPQEMERLLEILEPWLHASARMNEYSVDNLIETRRRAAAELCEFIREVADA